MKPFWSDGFDLDLLKLFPKLVDDLGARAEIPVWTVGNVDKRTGRLNHPTTWNTHGAFFWLVHPHLKRDDKGWFNIEGCAGHDPEIECTWLEFLRDQWVHSYSAVLMPHGQLFQHVGYQTFRMLMYHVRKFTPLTATQIGGATERAREWVEWSTLMLEEARRATL